MTWGNDPALVEPIVGMMMGSRQAVVDYMTPLGLAHQMATGHHYGPGPWISDLGRPDWNPVYYHRADAEGHRLRPHAGRHQFDRAICRAGRASVGAISRRSATIICSGSTTCRGTIAWPADGPSGTSSSPATPAASPAVGGMRRTWAALAPRIDAQRHAEVADFLAIQEDEAQWWRDASIAYFQSLSRRPLPAGIAAPAHDLDYYRAIRTPYAPGDSE